MNRKKPKAQGIIPLAVLAAFYGGPIKISSDIVLAKIDASFPLLFALVVPESVFFMIVGNHLLNKTEWASRLKTAIILAAIQSLLSELGGRREFSISFLIFTVVDGIAWGFTHIFEKAEYGAGKNE